jgi:hypothetical protein
MATSAGSWKKGQSGNPRGRPPKKRQLTLELERALKRSVVLYDGEKISGKRYVASLVVQGLTNGKIKLSNGETIDLAPEDVLALMRWSFSQVDGPPPQKTEVTGENGGALAIVIIDETTEQSDNG